MAAPLLIPNRILFIPVSSPSGIGEYVRSMIIAKALLNCWPKCEIHFVLNNKVNYLAECPYHVHTCQGSATKDSATVNQVIKTLQPDLVIFDAAGRAKQFKQAKQVGAKVAFISQHSKKRARGLKLNRLFYTDIHWVVQPDFCMKGLNLWQQTKLALFNKAAPQNIGAVFEFPNNEIQNKILSQLNLIEQDFILFNAGSGGHRLAGELATDIYYQAAKDLHRRAGIKIVMIFGSNYPDEIVKDKSIDIICLNQISNQNFIALLIAAKGLVISAGDTLLQAISFQKPCVAAAVSPDQGARLKLCSNQQGVLSAQANAKDLSKQALKMMNEHTHFSHTTNFSQKRESVNSSAALDIIINDLKGLFSTDNNDNLKPEFKKGSK